MVEMCDQLPDFKARPASSEIGSCCQGAQCCQVLGIKPLENSHAGFLFCCPSSPHVLEGGMEMQSPAVVQMHQLRCMLSGILVPGLQPNRDQNLASESVILKQVGLSMEREQQNQTKVGAQNTELSAPEHNIAWVVNGKTV